MPNRTSKRGFTIVELLVTLAVAAILMGIAIPAFNDFVAERRMTSVVNDFVLAVSYARSEAARRGGPVSVRAAAPAADNEWGGGYCVVDGAPGGCGGAVFRRFEPVGDGMTFLGTEDFAGRAILTFNSRGMLVTGGVGSIALCNEDDGVRDRAVDVEFIGRAIVRDQDQPVPECDA